MSRCSWFTAADHVSQRLTWIEFQISGAETSADAAARAASCTAMSSVVSSTCSGFKVAQEVGAIEIFRGHIAHTVWTSDCQKHMCVSQLVLLVYC